MSDAIREAIKKQLALQAQLREHPGHANQKVHGRRYGSGDAPAGTYMGAGTEDDPIVTSNCEVAAWALANDKFVQLRDKKQVATLIDVLANEVEMRKQMGRKAPDYNLCKVSVPKTNLFCAEHKGYERVTMPQFKGVPNPGSKADQMLKAGKLKLDPSGEVDVAPLWMKKLKTMGVKSKRVEVRADHLKASQRELNGATVAGIAGAMSAGTFPKDLPPMVITRDGYVLDGHHRWAGSIADQYMSGKRGSQVKIAAIEVDMSITDAYRLGREFTADIGLPTVSMSQNKFIDTKRREAAT